MATQQKSLNSLANVAHGNRKALDYLLAEKGGVCAVANNVMYLDWHRGKLRLNYIRSLNKPVDLGKWLFQWGLSLTYFIQIGLIRENSSSKLHFRHYPA